MNRKSDTMFIAYLAFILICIIIKCFFIISDSGTEYEKFFQRLVIAVTISSYFFVISDSILSTSDRKKYQQDKMTQIGKEIISLSNEMIIETNKKDNPSEKELESQKELQESVKAIEKTIYNWADQRIHNHFTVIFNIVGFLSFFLCLSFQEVSNRFIQQQDIFTLLAFLIMLSVPYINELENQKVDKSITRYKRILEMVKSRREKMKEVITHE